MNKLANQALLGTGLTTNIKGIDAYSTTFAVGGLEDKIPSPNYSDVIRASVAQIRRNKVIGLTTDNYARPNIAIVHPDVAAIMDMEKDDNGQYLIIPFKTKDGSTVVARCTVVESDHITNADTFYVLDGLKYHLDISTLHATKLEWGFGTGDWENGRLTLRMSVRAVGWARDNEKGAIVKGSFATAIAALLKPTS